MSFICPYLSCPKCNSNQTPYEDNLNLRPGKYQYDVQKVGSSSFGVEFIWNSGPQTKRWQCRPMEQSELNGMYLFVFMRSSMASDRKGLVACGHRQLLSTCCFAMIFHFCVDLVPILRPTLVLPFALRANQRILAECGRKLVWPTGAQSHSPGGCTSVKDLRDAAHRFVKQHNKSSAKPFIWTKSATVILEKVGKVSKLKDHTNQTGR